MEISRVTVFFYGLFMDDEALRANGFEPTNMRKAHVNGMALRIGERATLVQNLGSAAYGILMEMTRAEIDRLYADPNLTSYCPETVVAQLADGSNVAAQCFNLLTPPATDEANPVYAARLHELAHRLGLPNDYVASLI